MQTDLLLSLILPMVLVIVLVIVYIKFIRPWQLTWGSTDEEISKSMPGDEIVTKPSFNATRAVTIFASPEKIYPWIVQMGVKRAGWYSYDMLDNLGRPSAESILPEHQNIQIGDVIAMSPDGKQGMKVNDFKANEWMLWWDNKGDSTWVWEIVVISEQQCRLITRVRTKYRLLSSALAFNLLIEFFDIIMMRKCMLGIKKRAEKFQK